MDGVCVVLLQNLCIYNLRCFIANLFVAVYALPMWRGIKRKSLSMTMTNMMYATRLWATLGVQNKLLCKNVTHGFQQAGFLVLSWCLWYEIWRYKNSSKIAYIVRQTPVSLFCIRYSVFAQILTNYGIIVHVGQSGVCGNSRTCGQT